MELISECYTMFCIGFTSGYFTFKFLDMLVTKFENSSRKEWDDEADL